MSIIFECERDGQHYITCPCTNEQYALYPVNSMYQLLRETPAGQYPDGPLAYLREQGVTPQYRRNTTSGPRSLSRALPTPLNAAVTCYA